MTASVLVPVLLAIAGGVMYHAAAKAVPKDLAPALVLVVAYATALGISALAYVCLPGNTVPSLRLTHPAVLGLGVGAAMIEVGYVLTYRTGFPVSVTSVLVNGMVAAFLVPVGLLAFGERLSFTRGAGLALCLAGMWLLRH